MKTETQIIQAIQTKIAELTVKRNNMLYKTEDNEDYSIHDMPENILLSGDYYPSPTLEELLRVSPIFINVGNHGDRIAINYKMKTRFKYMTILLSDNTAEAVAKIILEYYKQKE